MSNTPEVPVEVLLEESGRQLKEISAALKGQDGKVSHESEPGPEPEDYAKLVEKAACAEAKARNDERADDRRKAEAAAKQAGDLGSDS